MWGSTFSDLAKKAQELQEQANQAASSLSTSSPGNLFNLDAMQQQVTETATRHHQQPEPEQAVVRPPRLDHILSTPTASTKSPIPKGKLQVPMKSMVHKEEADLKEPSDSANDQQVMNGWSQEDELDLEEQEESSEKASETAAVVEEPAGGELQLDVQKAEHPEKDAPEHEQHLVDKDASEHARENDASEHEHQPEKDASEHEQQPEKVVEEAYLGERHEKSDDVEPVAEEVAVSEAHQEQASAAPEIVPQQQVAEESVPHQEQQLDDSSEHQSTQIKQDTMTSGDAEASSEQPFVPKQSLLILTSSFNRQSVARQQNVFTVLNVKGIPFETIDAGDASKRELRDHLLAVSKGTAGGITYPQFFHINLLNGSPSYWGDYERFEYTNDDGNLEKELLGDTDEKDSNDALDNRAPVAENESIHHNGDSSAHNGDSNAIDTNIVESKEESSSRAVVSDDLLEQFSEQMKRVEENHQSERSEIEQRHLKELEGVRQSLNHDACNAAYQDLEERLLAQIREKENELHELMRVNEGYTLKMDVLKREVTGTQALLEARDSDMGKANQENSLMMQSLEEKIKDGEERIVQEQQAKQKLEESLEKTKGELAAAKQDHADLKARVKGVAAELKERRSECRELHARVDDLTKLKRDMQSQIENFEFRLSDQDKNRSETNEEMEQLRVKLVDNSSELEKVNNLNEELNTKHEKALAEYKKKAQSSLALANSRTAAAIQAKEEAELEARAARSTADSAMERAVKAEISSKEAIAEAKAYVKEMESEKEKALKLCHEATSSLKEAGSRLKDLQESLDKATENKQQLTAELDRALSDLTAEKVGAASLQCDLSDAKDRIVVLRDDLATLREKLRRAEEVRHSDASEERAQASSASHATTETADDESIAILQQELHEANQAVDDLKEALKNAVELNDRLRQNGSEQDKLNGSDQPTSATNGGAGSTPLFYAMEKQVELNAARAEISRLANLLSDAQSDKMAAYESMEDMRTRMEDAEARLQRYEKLRPTGAAIDSSGGAQPQNVVGSETPANSGAVNIEYLKNIMLSYLSAKSTAEKRALVPVIGAVLCLTPDEQRKALESLDESASIGGVGHSFFESLSDKLLSK